MKTLGVLSPIFCSNRDWRSDDFLLALVTGCVPCPVYVVVHRGTGGSREEEGVIL